MERGNKQSYYKLIQRAHSWTFAAPPKQKLQSPSYYIKKFIPNSFFSTLVLFINGNAEAKQKKEFNVEQERCARTEEPCHTNPTVFGINFLIWNINTIFPPIKIIHQIEHKKIVGVTHSKF